MRELAVTFAYLIIATIGFVLMLPFVAYWVAKALIKGARA